LERYLRCPAAINLKLSPAHPLKLSRVELGLSLLGDWVAMGRGVRGTSGS